MSYRKVTYPVNVDVFRWPNDPRVPGAAPDNAQAVRWMWYPKWGISSSLSFPGLSTAIVIIAFPLGAALFDAADSPIGFGDYLRPNIARTRLYQILLRCPTALGYPNQTMMALVTDECVFPAGPP